MRCFALLLLLATTPWAQSQDDDRNNDDDNSRRNTGENFPFLRSNVPIEERDMFYKILNDPTITLKTKEKQLIQVWRRVSSSCLIVCLKFQWANRQKQTSVKVGERNPILIIGLLSLERIFRISSTSRQLAATRSGKNPRQSLSTRHRRSPTLCKNSSERRSRERKRDAKTTLGAFALVCSKKCKKLTFSKAIESPTSTRFCATRAETINASSRT